MNRPAFPNATQKAKVRLGSHVVALAALLYRDGKVNPWKQKNTIMAIVAAMLNPVDVQSNKYQIPKLTVARTKANCVSELHCSL